MTLALQDWRELPAARILPLLSQEQRRWRDTLGWDLSHAWAPVEPARLAGALPGFVAREDDGRIYGWTFFGMHHHMLQVAALLAETAGVTAALVDGIMRQASAAGAASVLAFTFEQAPGLGEAFRAHGCATERYAYLSAAPLAGAYPDDDAVTMRPWATGDLDPFIELCAGAYAGSTYLRPFAPGGSMPEWREYAAQLVEQSGCGTLLPEASVMAIDRASGSVIGAVLSTRLDPSTVHLAQVVVSPEARRRHLGLRLVERARAAARADVFGRVTLLVADSNVAATRLYARLGFHETAAFLAASSAYPRRSTSEAVETGGDSTLR